MLKVLRSRLVPTATSVVLLGLLATRPAPAAEPAACRELERKFDLIKSDMVSVR